MINQTNHYNTSNAVVHNTHYLHSHNAEHNPTRVFAAIPQNLHQLYDTDSGDYMVLGNSHQVKFGAWYCEGFAHALAIHQANGDGQITLSNAKNLPVVLCDTFNLKTVVAEKHAQGCDHIRIVAEKTTVMTAIMRYKPLMLSMPSIIIYSTHKRLSSSNALFPRTTLNTLLP